MTVATRDLPLFDSEIAQCGCAEGVVPTELAGISISSCRGGVSDELHGRKITVRGFIARKSSILGSEKNGWAASDRLADVIREAAADSWVKFVWLVFRNSIAGSLHAIDRVAAAVDFCNAKKPITCRLFENVGGPAYMIATAARGIVAHRRAFIGALGVFGQDPHQILQSQQSYLREFVIERRPSIDRRALDHALAGRIFSAEAAEHFDFVDQISIGVPPRTRGGTLWLRSMN